jgi:hypothetical protein
MRTDERHFSAMYGMRDLPNGASVAFRKPNGLESFKFNLCRSVVTTAAAHIASKRPKPKFQTDDADWSLVRKAQGCEQAVKGIFTANSAYELGRDVFVDGAVGNIGALHVYGEHGRVKYERVFPGELIVDDRDGYYGSPRVIFRAKLVERAVLEELYAEQLKKQGRKDGKVRGKSEDLFLRHFDRYTPADTSNVDQVLVIEGWRLGTTKDKDGKWTGRHVIFTDAETLLDEEYTRERFPIVVFRYAKRQTGFWGAGLVEQLRGHQAALNYVHKKLADIMHNVSRSKLVTQVGAKGQKVKVAHLDNDPTTITEVPYGVNPPQVQAQNAVPTELFNWRREIIEDAYAEIGVSQMHATGQVPKGVDSGAAMREAEDIGSRRFAPVAQTYEQFFVDLARVTIDELRDMDERGELEPVSVTMRKGSRARVELIKWRDVALEDHAFTLDVTPASSLPDSTAGRTATVIDWMNAGLCTPQEAKALLDHPDLERFKSLDLAAYEVVLDTIESIIEDGKYYPPEPTDDLELALKLATQSYSKFRLRSVPQPSLDLLLQYLEDVQALLDQAKAAAPQAMPAMPGAVPPMPSAPMPGAPPPMPMAA